MEATGTLAHCRWEGGAGATTGEAGAVAQSQACRPTTGPFRRGERLRPWGPGGGSEAEVPPAVYVTAK